ncbi:MAG: hypothetical protein ACKPJD_03175, partial [Planctomycetaceae bacterium]
MQNPAWLSAIRNCFHSSFNLPFSNGSAHGNPRRRRRHTEIQHALNAPVATESLEDRTLLSTLMVGSGQTYPTIQSAVDAATTSDTIQVLPGTYNETVSITKSNLTFQGPNSDVVGSGTRTAEATVTGGFVLNGVSNVTIRGFNITGSNVADSRGVLLGNTTAIPGVFGTPRWSGALLAYGRC